MVDYSRALDVALDAAQLAGRLLRDEFHRPGGPRGRRTHADIDEVVERAIYERLSGEFSWGIRGEECGFDVGDGGSHLWLVDPHDGTSVFLAGRRGSAVSIAALRDGIPILGVVYAFNYPDDEGDLFCWAEGCGPLRRNGQPVDDVSMEPIPDDDHSQIVLLWSGVDSNAVSALRCTYPHRFAAVPSVAYRLALAAAGSGVASVTINGPQGWDYAGGHALLRGVGGILLNHRGEPICYTADGQSFAIRCFGGIPSIVESLWRRDWGTTFATGTRPPSTAFDLTRLQPGEAVADVGRVQRAQGCLLGQFTGDSLGGQVEFQSADQILRQFPDGVHKLVDGGVWDILAGQPTDDSELALMLARTLVRKGTLHDETVLHSYVHWLLSRPFDIGGTIAASLNAAVGGKTSAERLSLARHAANTESQANGSLMRISPLGVFAAGNPEGGIELARRDSRLTHPHPVCQDACAVFVAAIAATVAEGLSPQETYDCALNVARQQHVEPAVLRVLELARQDHPEDYETHQGWVLIALQNAFYQLLNADSLEAGVVASVMAGGDTDTNAAIAGALLGAVYGRDAVPRQWTRMVISCRPLRRAPTAHPRPTEFWPVDVLELAEALLLAGEKGDV